MGTLFHFYYRGQSNAIFRIIFYWTSNYFVILIKFFCVPKIITIKIWFLLNWKQEAPSFNEKENIGFSFQKKKSRICVRIFDSNLNWLLIISGLSCSIRIPYFNNGCVIEIASIVYSKIYTNILFQLIGYEWRGRRFVKPT